MGGGGIKAYVACVFGGFSCLVFAVSKYSCFLWEINEAGCQSLSLCTKNRHCIWRNTLRITLITHAMFENEPGLLSNVCKGWSWSSCCITAPGSGVRSWARVNIRPEFPFNVLSVSVWVSSRFSGFLTHHKPITMSIMLLSTLQAPGPPQHWPGSCDNLWNIFHLCIIKDYFECPCFTHHHTVYGSMFVLLILRDIKMSSDTKVLWVPPPEVRQCCLYPSFFIAVNY